MKKKISACEGYTICQGETAGLPEFSLSERGLSGSFCKRLVEFWKERSETLLGLGLFVKGLSRVAETISMGSE